MEKFDIRSYIMLKDGSSIEIGDYLTIEEKDGSSYTGTLTGFSQFSLTILKEGENFSYTVVSTQIVSVKRTTKQHSVEIVDNRLFVQDEEGCHGFYNSGKVIKVTTKSGGEHIGRLRVNERLCDDAVTLGAVELFTLYDIPGEVCAIELKDIQSVKYYFGVGDKPLQ
jgi:small nuclear ribonucleoprotein (snRNP)-like protein